MRRAATVFIVAFLCALTVSSVLTAQSIPYHIAQWEPDSFGNHRAVVHVAVAAPAVRVHIQWRRRDLHPELKRVEVVDAAGRRVLDAWAPAVDRESGDIVFAAASAGDYAVYYMPYQGTFRSNYPKITYRLPDTTATAEWRVASGVDSLGLATGKWRSLPQATVSEFDDVDSLASVYPMEVIATAAETEALRNSRPGALYLLFPEDRTRPIKMRHSLPERWTAGADGPVTGTADRGEFYAFQIGLWALRPVTGVSATFSDLAGPDGARIEASAFQSFNTGGVDWQGRRFVRAPAVDSGVVQPLWCGVMVPEGAAAGEYDGTVTVTAS
ncbi:MAG: glycoside hydrolase domain-containing protein, partial [Gemmatimonadales bacterium]